MTEAISHYTTPGSHNLKIPSRDEFHRFAMNKLTQADFMDDKPTGFVIDRISQSTHWSRKMVRRENG